MLIYAKYIEMISLSTLWFLDLKDCEGATAAQVSMPFSRSLGLQMDFWSCIKYHMVLRMMGKKVLHVRLHLFIYCHSIVGLSGALFVAFYLHLFLFLFLLICPQQLSLCA